ncbi:thioredoxin family protein [Azospirillum sp.]|uniref:SoxW family protein n=1 Tax=Azospirillum sp. TaxID=34012 RepID=UPI002D26166E|nr:thioredoxin family protein [Azospirillum sp.]HYD65035.1 thioredoxin family protein [Azospirillum sp.]
MITRRTFALGLLAAGGSASLGSVPAAAEALMTEDGLHTQPWFLQSFLHLHDDLAEAQAAGKRFAIVWEQRGCIYCRDMHVVNFAVPEVERYVRDHFTILSLNLHGARKVTDFDGEELEERKLARKYGIVFTPTIQFFPEPDQMPKGKHTVETEVFRQRGLLKPPEFLAMFRFVREKAYDATRFDEYLKRAAG